MAEQNITTVFNADVRDLKKGITEANNQIKLANSAFKAASDGTKEWEKSSEGLKAKITQVKSVLEAQNQKLDIYNKKLESAKKYEKEASDEVKRLEDALAKAKDEFGENSSEVKILEAQLVQAKEAESKMHQEVVKATTTLNNQQAEINKNETELKKLGDELIDAEAAEKKAANGADDLSDSLEDSKKSAKGAGDGFTVMNGALASLVADGIRKAVDALKDLVAGTIEVGKNFDSSMSQVAAVSGATGDELEQLRDKAKQMGADTKFTASEAADAFNYMAMAGWKTTDMLSGIEGILALAAAGNTDLATTSDIVTDALTAFGQTAAESGRLADIMAAASSNANTNVTMMGESFKYVAPVAGAMGYSMEDTSIAIGLMANAGIKASQSGTALRTLLTNMANPTDAMAGAMQNLGISLDDGQGNMKSLAEIMQDLRSGFGELQIPVDEFNSAMLDLDGELQSGAITQKQYDAATEELTKKAFGAEGALKAQAAATLAGKEGMSGLLAIVNASDEDFNKLTNAVNNSNGAAEDMAATMQDNLGGDLTVLGSKFEGLQITLYEKFEPALRACVSALQSMVDAITSVVNWLSEHQTAAIAIAGVIGTLTAAIGAYVIAQNASAIATAASTAATTAWAAVMAFVTSPVTLVVAAIGALITIIVLLVKNWDTVKEVTLKTWESIKKTVTDIIDKVKKKISDVWNSIKKTTTETWNNVKSAISTPIENAKKTVSTVIDNVKSTISNAWNNIKSTTSSAWEKIKSAITDPIEAAKKTVSGIIESIKKTVKNIFDGIKPKLSLSLPKITVSGGKAPWGIAGKGELPSFKVTWNKLGGVFGKPTVMQGLGEDGAEAIVPLERNKYWIRKVADEMLKQVNLSNQTKAAINSLTNNTNNNFTQIINAPKQPSRIELYRDTKNLLALKGVR